MRRPDIGPTKALTGSRAEARRAELRRDFIAFLSTLPTSMAGETVLDLGSGSGMIMLIASLEIGHISAT